MRKNKGYITIAGAIIFSSLLIFQLFIPYSLHFLIDLVIIIPIEKISDFS